MSVVIVDSPLGPLRLAASADALISIDWEWVQQREAVSVNHPVLQQAASQLRGYFSGQLTQFSVPLALQGTAFQQRVWRALRHQPFGTATTYGDLAKTIGHPKAARAIGGAVGSNPIPIIIPCHRVLRAGAGLGGFTGGLTRKKILLSLEGIDWN